MKRERRLDDRLSGKQWLLLVTGAAVCWGLFALFMYIAIRVAPDGLDSFVDFIVWFSTFLTGAPAFVLTIAGVVNLSKAAEYVPVDGKVSLRTSRVRYAAGSEIDVHVSLTAEEALSVQGGRVDLVRLTDTGEGYSNASVLSIPLPAGDATKGFDYSRVVMLRVPRNLVPRTDGDRSQKVSWQLRAKLDTSPPTDNETTKGVALVWSDRPSVLEVKRTTVYSWVRWLKGNGCSGDIAWNEPIIKRYRSIDWGREERFGLIECSNGPVERVEFLTVAQRKTQLNTVTMRIAVEWPEAPALPATDPGTGPGKPSVRRAMQDREDRLSRLDAILSSDPQVQMLSRRPTIVRDMLDSSDEDWEDDWDDDEEIDEEPGGGSPASVTLRWRSTTTRQISWVDHPENTWESLDRLVELVRKGPD